MKLYREYRTITREQAFARCFDGKWLNVTPNPEFARSNQYDYHIARELLQKFPQAKQVDFCEPGQQNKTHSYLACEDTVIYVKRRAMVYYFSGDYHLGFGKWKLREVLGELQR